MVDAASKPMTVSQAAEYTGLSETTVRKRADLWFGGGRGPDALKAGRTHGNRGARLIDRRDAERVRLQVAGELDANVTADEFQGMPHGHAA